MQIIDGSMAMNMNAQHHMEHFDNVLNLNMNTDYHYGMEYWNGSYKNGSTPMKEMEGETRRRSYETACSIKMKQHKLKGRNSVPQVIFQLCV